MKVRHGSNGNTVFTDHLVATSDGLEILYQNANVRYDQKQIVAQENVNLSAILKCKLGTIGTSPPSTFCSEG